MWRSDGQYRKAKPAALEVSLKHFTLDLLPSHGHLLRLTPMVKSVEGLELREDSEALRCLELRVPEGSDAGGWVSVLGATCRVRE